MPCQAAEHRSPQEAAAQISTAFATISLGENELGLIAAIAFNGHVKQPFDQLACLLQQLGAIALPCLLLFLRLLLLWMPRLLLLLLLLSMCCH